MPRRRNTSPKARPDAKREIRGVELKPIRVVERKLTRPDGSTVTVEVPVYPPFRLEDAKRRTG